MDPTFPGGGSFGSIRPGGVPNPANGSADHPAFGQKGGRGEESFRGYTVFALVALVIAELGFVLAAILWVELTTTQALQAAAGATTIAVLAFYGKAMLLAVGRRILGNSS